MRIFQRYTDWQRERRIVRMGRQLAWLLRRGEKALARALQAAWMAELAMRSPGQVARMERKQGIK